MADLFRRDVRAELQDYLALDDITPKSLERLMSRLLAITVHERGTQAAAGLASKGINRGMTWIATQMKHAVRRR